MMTLSEKKMEQWLEALGFRYRRLSGYSDHGWNTDTGSSVMDAGDRQLCCRNLDSNRGPKLWDFSIAIAPAVGIGRLELQQLFLRLPTRMTTDHDARTHVMWVPQLQPPVPDAHVVRESSNRLL